MVYLWLGVVIVAVIIEAAVPQLVSVWFAIGGLCAMISDVLDAPWWLQVLIFLLVSFIAIACTRPLAKKLLSKNAVSTNADRVIGKKAIVVENVNNTEGVGQVKVLGSVWSAVSQDPNEVISAGETVSVLRIDGVKLIVSRSAD